MNISNIQLRHIVDVNGQLLGIEAGVIDAAMLLSRANCPAGSQLWMVRAGERIEVQAKQAIRLSENDVLFFETSARAAWRLPQQLLAA